MNIYELLFESYQHGRGRTLTHDQLGQLLHLITQMDQRIGELMIQYGEIDPVEAEVISVEENKVSEETSEGEAQDVASAQEVVTNVVVSEAPGLDSEVAGLDSSSETQES